MNPVAVGLRYGLNLMTMVARQEGYLAAVARGSRFVATEVGKLPKAARLARQHRVLGRGQPLTVYSEALVRSLEALGVEFRPYHIDEAGFRAHLGAFDYPRYYAAGAVAKGGVREKKVLEYYVSCELLGIRSGDVVIDVASEWSIFPDMLRQTCGAIVYRQDLVYPPGINGDRIGGSAAAMPLEAEFADQLVLHNAFEHFEGSADSAFVREAGRVLKPGGQVCILPLFMSEKYCIVTDPLVDCRSVAWDEDAQVVEQPWYHNRFGRYYDAAALQKRVLAPAQQAGFRVTIFHLVNVRQVLPESRMHFALLLSKPAAER